MLLLDTAYFGKYVYLPMGWIFMACLVAIEAVVMSKVLAHAYFNTRVAFVALISNAVSGIAGAYTSIAINGGRLLTVWFPWVSSHEVNTENEEELLSFFLYCVIAFVFAVIIELIINSIFLNKRYEFRPVMRATIIANVISFVVGTFVLYSYSFLIFD